jgi:hypothetical protein
MERTLRLLTLLTLLGTAAWSADHFYIGSWKITSATVAPWWNDTKQKPDAVESKSLVGQTVAIGANAISGPRQVTCKNPHYQTKEYPADMLFQGMFGEMHSRDQSVDPGKTAASIGFKGSKWKTLETGCDNEVELHFLDGGTAAFGLNNYIYILKKK